MSIDPIEQLSEPPALQPFDAARVESAIRELLIGIGENPDREGLAQTPARVAKSYAEIFGGLHQTARDVLTTTFSLGHDELVVVRDIPIYSTCEHHLLPFHGVGHVGYIPGEDGKITGLSKIARLVDMYSRRPQVQEPGLGQDLLGQGHRPVHPQGGRPDPAVRCAQDGGRPGAR